MFQKGNKHQVASNRRRKDRKSPTQRVESAIKKVLANAEKDEAGKSLGLFNLMNALYKQACSGDVAAHKEFMDRYAGKVTQRVEAEHTQFVVQIGNKELEVVDEPLVIEH